MRTPSASEALARLQAQKRADDAEALAEKAARHAPPTKAALETKSRNSETQDDESATASLPMSPSSPSYSPAPVEISDESSTQPPTARGFSPPVEIGEGSSVQPPPSGLSPHQDGALVFQQQSPHEGPMNHVLLRRHKHIFGAHTFEVRTALTMPNGSIVPNRLVASVQKCFQKKHASYKIHGPVACSSASKADRIGVLRSNMRGSAYTLHDGDERRNLATMSHRYVMKFAPVETTCTITFWHPEQNKGAMYELQKVMPVWDTKINAWKTDFSSKQHAFPVAPSTKNVQYEFEGEVVMIFHRVKTGDRDLFSLEYKWPLNGVQALGLALLTFDASVLDESGVQHFDPRKVERAEAEAAAAAAKDPAADGRDATPEAKQKAVAAPRSPDGFAP